MIDECYVKSRDYCKSIEILSKLYRCFLQYNSTVDSNWKKGQGHMWDSEVLHIGANNGMQNKYTLQVSGFLNVGR